MKEYPEGERRRPFATRWMMWYNESTVDQSQASEWGKIEE
jgi:hypothetical protein